MYKVLHHFVDLQDDRFEYKAGDKFPRDGLKVTKIRFMELATNKNKRGIPLIEEVAEPKGEGPKAEKPKTDKEPAKRGKKKNA